MKKIIPIVIVGFLVASAFGTMAITINKKIDNDQGFENVVNSLEKTSTIKVSFSNYKIEDDQDGYVSLSLEDNSNYLTTPGQPMLPEVVKNFELPFGARNINVVVTPKNIQETSINAEICPAPAAIPLIYEELEGYAEPVKDQVVYASSDPFPSEWYSYRVGCGLNGNNEHVTHLSVHICPVRYAPVLGTLFTAETADIDITFDQPTENIIPDDCEYDMVIIAPSIFQKGLVKLIKHKNDMGINTFFKPVEEIYDEYDGIDAPEEIKLFIKDAIETYGITYVLLVGGLKNQIWAKPRDGPNQGTSGWYVPVRYTNCFDNPEHPLLSSSIYDPGVISDLYYADIYDSDLNFSTWDPNEDGFMAAWGYPDPSVKNDTDIDWYPDVNIGRLACRNILEVYNVVDKIIRYEKTAYDSCWFKKMTVLSGDGFLDQEDLNFVWDTNGLPDGRYTIYAQSRNKDLVAGPVDTIKVTVNKDKESVVTFNHDDHLQVSSYPYLPIAEITSPSPGDILGNTNVEFSPTEGQAYCNEFNGWADVEYVDGVMHIRGKSYDPEPYGNYTDIHVWIKNKNGDIVFDDWRYGLEMYYEGEWITGDRLLKGGGGALYYMPEDFKKDIVWASNGRIGDQSVSQENVIKALSRGAGFAFMSGHGSPTVWADHYPGVPGNRANGDFTGLKVTNIKIFPPFVSRPVLPMEKIKNCGKLPVVLIGGCHNSQFNVSFIPGLIDIKNKMNTWCHGGGTPECFSWYLVKMPNTGAIATLGNTGLGYGILGKDCTIGGLDGGICIEFCKQYGQNGYDILGECYSQTLTSYVNTFDMLNQDHAKSLQQWALLGDPSLMMGGYPED